MSPSDGELSGRVAIVTGAGVGIGAGIAFNVNAICPGPTLTAMYERNADEETRRERVAMVPKGRFRTPDDHGRIAVFLCSEAADPLCGLAIDVDGGSLLGWMPWEKSMAKRRRK